MPDAAQFTLNGTHEYRYERSSHFVAGSGSSDSEDGDAGESGDAVGDGEDDAGGDAAASSKTDAEVIATDDAISNAA